MIDKRQILTDLKKHLQKNFGDCIKEVILFGSQIHPDPKEYSDYDILIILNREYSGKDENKIIDLCYDIDLKYNILIDVNILSEKEVSSIRGKQTIYINAMQSGMYA